MKYSVSFSGGKDSTAMLHWLIEKGCPIDAIIFFDTGWEFPAMLKHIDLVEEKTGLKITRVHPKKSFDHWLRKAEIVARKGPMKGKVHRIGNGWPSPLRRWCSRQKINAIDNAIKELMPVSVYIGIAADEPTRVNTKGKYTKLYPLVEWGKTEQDCLDYCKELGYTWDGLYDVFQRVSCFCCPLQRIGELRALRKYYPELWAKMLEWDETMPSNEGFRGYATVRDLEERFKNEGGYLVMPPPEQSDS